MLGEKKILGLCMTKIHDRIRGYFSDEVNRAALAEGCKLVCFHCFEDSYCEDVLYSMGAKTIFDKIDFGVIDGLIICRDQFAEGKTSEELAQRAKQAGAPAVFVDGFDKPITDGSFTDCAKEVVGALLSAIAGECYEKEHRIRAKASAKEESSEQEMKAPAWEKLYHEAVEQERWADSAFAKLCQMVNALNVKEIFEPIAGLILPGSWFCLSSVFMRQADGTRWERPRSVAVPSTSLQGKKIRYVLDDEMLPETAEWLTDNTYYILTAVHASDQNCGYYAVETENAGEISIRYRITLRFGNLVCNAMMQQFRLKKKIRDIENEAFRDSVTQLPNQKGAVKWFEEFSADSENHQKSITVSVYSLPQYSDLVENQGKNEAEEMLKLVADKLRTVNSKDSFLARVSENEFLVISYPRDAGVKSDAPGKAAAEFGREMEQYNKEKARENPVEVNYGSTTAGAGWSGTLDAFIKYASNEMVLSRLKRGEIEQVRSQSEQTDYFGAFKLLVENNLFTYHFQPIVEAKSGEIFGYEALMRTTGGITLSPLEVLETAEKYNSLALIERATMFNILKRFSAEYEQFKGRRVFINTIPNYFLSDEDSRELMKEYGDYLDDIVIEVTERGTSSDEELDAIKRFRGKSGNVPIAIDDYGTGHSNIVNLLRYSPQIIKIDRYLISGIEKDNNKQLFLKNTMEFAAMNGIRVLAEGVETSEELRTVIEYGVDLIQGYYTGRPAPIPVTELKEPVRDEIIETNLLMTRFDINGQKVYTAKDGETCNLVKIALEHYNYLNITGGRVKIQGRKESCVNMVIRIADNANAVVELEEVNMVGKTESSIQLGKNSNAEIVLSGYNTLNKNGIRVPKNSRLRLTGNGSLLINVNYNSGVGIGTRYDEPYGEIIFENRGRIKIVSSGDRLIGVGGGTGAYPIKVFSGHLEVIGSGISVIGIGSASGDAFIRFEGGEISVKQSGNEAVAIGCIKGTCRIISEAEVNVVSDGESAVAIGCLDGKDCTVELKKGTVSAAIHCDVGSVLGTKDGDIAVMINNCNVNLYGEGSSITGLGSCDGECTTEISGGILDLKILSAGAMPFGNEKDRFVITGGNVICRNDDVNLNAVNAYGQKLHLEMKEGPVFEQAIRTEKGEYLYTARSAKEGEKICVYLP